MVVVCETEMSSGGKYHRNGEVRVRSGFLEGADGYVRKGVRILVEYECFEKWLDCRYDCSKFTFGNSWD